MSKIGQPVEVTNVINVLNTYLQWKSINGPPRGYLRYHPSSFGSCLRKAQYQRYTDMGYVKVDKEVNEARSIRIFDTGHSMHARWAQYFEGLGVLRGVWECKNKLCHAYMDDGTFDNSKITTFGKSRIHGKDNKIGCFKPKACVCGCQEFEYHEITVHDDELNFHGHCDQILDFSNFDPNMFNQGNPVDVLFKVEDLPKKPIVLDMKSINSFSFKSKLEQGPSLVYRTQLVIYCNILDLEYGILIYENKDDSSTKVYKVDRNPDMWMSIVKQANSLNDMVAEKLLPPPRPQAKTDYDCRYCEYQSICHNSKIWDDPNLDTKRLNFYGNF